MSEAEFHLTRSPYCSSRLRPDAAALGDWSFARLFDVERTVRVPCIGLQKALQEANVSRVDWFKTDSQGTDLRLFQSLGEALCRRVLAVEFEPGIINAYEGEDKLSAVLAAMDRPEFWLCDLDIRGTLRMSPDEAGRLEEGRTRAAFDGPAACARLGRDDLFEHVSRRRAVLQARLAARLGDCVDP